MKVLPQGCSKLILGNSRISIQVTHWTKNNYWRSFYYINSKFSMTNQKNLFVIENFDFIRKITSKNWFWSSVSLGWKSANSLTSVLNTPGVVLSRNIGPKTCHLFGLLIPISTTVNMRCECLGIIISNEGKFSHPEKNIIFTRKNKIQALLFPRTVKHVSITPLF